MIVQVIGMFNVATTHNIEFYNYRYALRFF